MVNRRAHVRKVPGFGGRYRIDDLGRVSRDGFELTPIRGRYVNMSWEGVVHRVDIARLVARCFLPNPWKLPLVNHKDGNQANNRVENLEWVEHLPVRVGRKRNPRHVLQFATDGSCIAEFASAVKAAACSGVSPAAIRNCLAGKSHSAGGFVWRYK